MASCPSRVKINGFHWRLLTTQRAWDEHGTDDTIGRTFNLKRLMVVKPGVMEPQEEATTVLHEVIHSAFSEGGWGHGDGKRRQEQAVLHLERTFYTVIRDNPKLLDYLRNPDPL